MNSLTAFLLCLSAVYTGSFLLHEQGCEQLLDIVVVLDGSETIRPNEFQIIREVMAKFVEDLGVEEGNKHFGAVVYSQEVSEVINLSGDRASLVQAMLNLKHPRQGTRTDLGIEAMIEVIKGSGRPDVPRVAIVFTDGESHEREKTLYQAQRAKDIGVNMFAVGIGSHIDSTELQEIASTPEQAFFIDEVADINDLVDGLEKEICPTTPPPTARPTATPSSVPERTPTLQPTKKPTEVPPKKGPCDGCRMRNGIGYSSHKQCNKFYQCSFAANGKLLRYHVQTCSPGTFWSQDLLTCDFIGNIRCKNDRCRTEPGLKSYKLGGDCADYIECKNRRSQAAKCRNGFSYSEEDDRCIADASCTTGGEEGGDSECNFWRVPGTGCSYFWKSGFQIWKMPCPGGTRFSQRECGCIYAGRNRCRPLPCKPLVDIDFNSAEPGEYDNYGAVVRNGLAYFDGKSNIKILTLANVKFTTKLTIYIKFKPVNSNYTRKVAEAVVTNGDCGLDSTISILNNGEETTFTIVDESDVARSVQETSSALWREGVFKVINGDMSSNINGKSGPNSAAFHKMPKRSQCAFQLGHGTGFENFRGWIDYIVVTTC